MMPKRIDWYFPSNPTWNFHHRKKTHDVYLPQADGVGPNPPILCSRSSKQPSQCTSPQPGHPAIDPERSKWNVNPRRFHTTGTPSPFRTNFRWSNQRAKGLAPWLWTPPKSAGFRVFQNYFICDFENLGEDPEIDGFDGGSQFSRLKWPFGWGISSSQANKDTKHYNVSIFHSWVARIQWFYLCFIHVHMYIYICMYSYILSISWRSII